MKMMENPVVAQDEEMIIDSVEKPVIETVSRGSDSECVNVKVKEEPDLGTMLKEEESLEDRYDYFISGKRRKMEIGRSVPTDVKSCTMTQNSLQVLQVKPENLDTPEVIEVESENLIPLVKMESVEEKKVDIVNLCSPLKEMKYSREQKPVYVRKTPVVARKVKVEDGEFPVEKDWYLVGRSLVTATSTSKGRKLEDNEVVNFTFPSTTINWKVPNIVRFNTKRCGEIGRLPMEWSNWAVSLLKSGKVKMLGRCVAAPPTLYMMQEIMLYVSFYIHSSIFSTDVSKSTWKIGSSPNVNSTLHPLLQLFKHLTIKPYQKAEFTPQELDSRKRSLNLEDDLDERAALLAIAKRRKGCPQYSEQNKDEEDAPDSYMNRVVGAVDSYNLEV